MMSLPELQEELSGLQFLVGQTCQRDIKEGRLHHGMGAVVQVVARR
jgi:hypothetical protein